MGKLLFIIGLLLMMTGCITTADSLQNRTAAIETWTGHAIGRGAECSDAEVKVDVLEDLTIIGTARSTDYNMIVQLKGKLDQNRDFVASGSGVGGVSVTYKGNITGDSARGTWMSSRANCEGTWEMAKVNP